MDSFVELISASVVGFSVVDVVVEEMVVDVVDAFQEGGVRVTFR